MTVSIISIVNVLISDINIVTMTMIFDPNEKPHKKKLSAKKHAKFRR
jgi:hypothetical protein